MTPAEHAALSAQLARAEGENPRLTTPTNLGIIP